MALVCGDCGGDLELIMGRGIPEAGHVRCVDCGSEGRLYGPGGSGLAVEDQVTYAVTIDPVSENVDIDHPILTQFIESDQELSELIQSGGLVIETDDKDKAKALAEELRATGAEVEIERREPQPDENRRSRRDCT